MERLTPQNCNELFQFRAEVVAKNVDRAIRDSGLSTQDVAYLANTSVNVIHYARKGFNRNKKTFIPDIPTLDKIAKVTQVTITELIIKKVD